MNSKILLVEDVAEDQHIVVHALGKNSTVTSASTLAHARDLLAKVEFDLILLDIGLPDGDGFKFCANLQHDDRTKNIPVIFLTSMNDTPDKVMGFSLGAEDYITKPFDPFELRARVESRLRKISEKKSQEMVVAKGDLKVNVPLQRAFIVNDGAETHIDLTPLEFKLLFHLFQHEDHVFTREQLLGTVWGSGVNVLDRTVDMHVSSLRKKIGKSSFTIKAVHGVGYRFTSIHEK